MAPWAGRAQNQRLPRDDRAARENFDVAVGAAAWPTMLGRTGMPVGWEPRRSWTEQQREA